MPINKLTEGQLLFRLQDFYGAEQDALKICDYEYAQECSDIVSVIREVLEYRKLSEHSAAIKDVIAERARQVSEEGWTPAHDDEHTNGELADAAATYAYHANDRRLTPPNMWPWTSEQWKQTTPRQNLVKAGALILSEIERMDRAASTERGIE